MLPIVTERLVLRDFQPDDFEAFFATTMDPTYRQYYPERESSRAFLQEVFARIVAATAAPQRTTYQLAVCLPEGELIGTCGVRLEVAEEQQASFGCAIAARCWGQGYAYEAARHTIDLGFAALPIHRLYAETLSANQRARALVERLGMQLEGTLRHTKYFRECWWDTVIYAILREDWC